MVNHIMKRIQGQATGLDARMVPVKNLTGRIQIHGVYKLIPDAWVEVPYDLARRLTGTDDYEVEGQWVPARKPRRLENNVLRHPAACSPHTVREVHDRGELANIALGRIWRGEVEKFDIAKLPSVRIVVPVYNSPQLLKQCVESLKKTKYPASKLQCVFVDNASSDPETLKLLKGVNCVRMPAPVSFSRAVNAGMLDYSCGQPDYFVLFNQDCRIIDEMWLYALMRWMELRPRCAVAGAKLLYPDGTLQHAGLDIPAGSCGMHRFLASDPTASRVNFYERVTAVTGAVFCLRGSVVQEFGGLDEDLPFGCEDSAICLRANAAGYEVWYVPSCEVEHIDNGIRKTNTRDSERIRSWTAKSSEVFRGKWGAYVDSCAKSRIDFVLPDNNGAAGGTRVVWALANSLINAGVEARVLTFDGSQPNDPDFPILFETAAMSAVSSFDVLVATRADTVLKTQQMPARKRYYLVQQIETVMARYFGLSASDVELTYEAQDYEIITIGEHLAKQLEERGRKSHVLDVGFYRDLYPYHLRPAIGFPARVLMYGSTAGYKGADDAAAIAQALREKIPGVRICSFHRNYPKPAWSDEHFAPQSTAEVAQVYAGADIYVYASLSDGFAMTPIEAMACGTPVVLTDFPGKDQYARHEKNCLIAPFRDAEQVAECAGRVIQDTRLRGRLVDAGLATADRYDWKNVGRQYVQLILGSAK